MDCYAARMHWVCLVHSFNEFVYDCLLTFRSVWHVALSSRSWPCEYKQGHLGPGHHGSPELPLRERQVDAREGQSMAQGTPDAARL